MHFPLFGLNLWTATLPSRNSTLRKVRESKHPALRLSASTSLGGRDVYLQNYPYTDIIVLYLTNNDTPLKYIK